MSSFLPNNQHDSSQQHQQQRQHRRRQIDGDDVSISVIIGDPLEPDGSQSTDAAGRIEQRRGGGDDDGELVGDHDWWPSSASSSSSSSSSRTSDSSSSSSSKARSNDGRRDDNDDGDGDDDDSSCAEDEIGSIVSSFGDDNTHNNNNNNNNNCGHSGDEDGGFEPAADEIDGLAYSTHLRLLPAMFYRLNGTRDDDDRGRPWRDLFGTSGLNWMRKRHYGGRKRPLPPDRRRNEDGGGGCSIDDAMDEGEDDQPGDGKKDDDLSASPSKDDAERRRRRTTRRRGGPAIRRRMHQCHEPRPAHVSKEKSGQSKMRLKSRRRRCCRVMHWSNGLLASSILIWVSVQLLCYLSVPMLWSSSWLPSVDLQLDTMATSTQRITGRTRLRRRHQQLHPPLLEQYEKGIPSDPQRMLPGYPDGNTTLFSSSSTKEDTEKLPPGCDYADWQKERGSSLLTCNVIHELDLRWFLGKSYRGRGSSHYGEPRGRRQTRPGGNQTSVDTSSSQWQQHLQPRTAPGASRYNSTEANSPATPGQYLSSGLWRDVWSIRPLLWNPQYSHEGETDGGWLEQEIVVLKMMKAEHDVVHRNLERHRREAVTMEHLTYSPHVVDLFAYCGNSIVTEFASYDLETALQRRGGGPDGNADLRATSLQQLELSQQAAKAIEALHDNDIIHADVTSQQFLVVRSNISSPLLKINDFNRCRFVPRMIQANGENGSDGKNEKCDVRIPSAPGLYRSPEEYALQPLTPQMDIFSLGHVMYEIWTGTKAWKDMGGKHVREAVQNGQFQTQLATKNASNALGKLIPLCYSLDPQQRPTAHRLVYELKKAAKENNF